MKQFKISTIFIIRTIPYKYINAKIDRNKIDVNRVWISL